MSRSRLALNAVAILFVASCALSSLAFLDLAQTSMPYQDPTPEMLEKQAADIAAAERLFTVSTAIAGALALIGLAAFFHFRKHRQTRTTDHGQCGDH
ncbi:hypothetical protein [Phytohabitans houttuyneae]|uniref:Uncharacterized protein n=1 Tax=Phytohabitans houttuyneae TaxID=1076126 RepID=A0A6V8KAX3_9ACTN|nr:hypothetical protein [Phytohabitans houttuyneae]GFJ79106.1 hypothetical protein Phou_032860 [Phytohabitans houttuyneae]